MGSHRLQRVLICYDISDARRLRRVHRLVKDYAHPLQFSVFVADLNPQQIDLLWGQLEALIDPDVDRLHLFRLSALVRGAQGVAAVLSLPSGVMLLN